MFDFKHWTTVFAEHQANGEFYNDAVEYGVYVKEIQNPIWGVLGVHHLTPEENKEPNEEFGKRNVLVEILCEQWERDKLRAVNWGWEGQQVDQPSPPIYGYQKGPDEPLDLPLNLGMILSVYTHGSDVVMGFSSNHLDEETDTGELGNTIGHHSFYVVFQQLDRDGNFPPLPDSDPDPPVEPEPDKITAMLINKAWLDTQSVDDDGFIRVSYSALKGRSFLLR